MSLEPERLNFTAVKGATFRKVLTLSEDNEPLDLDGYSATMTVRTGRPAVVALTLTTLNDGIVIDPVESTITIYISDEATAALAWTLGSYNLFLTSPSGDSDALLYGNFSVKVV